MYKAMSLPKPLLFLMIFTVISIGDGLSLPAQAQNILFEDSFSGGTVDGTKKWHTVSGDWKIGGGTLSQVGQADKALILVTDEHWDESWNEYWVYAKVKLLGGVNGPLIFWRYHSDGTEGGLFGEEVPPRMKESGRRHVIYWALNLESKRSVVIRAIRTIVKEFEPTETDTKLSTGDDYWVKIENMSDGYRLFLTEDSLAAAKGDYGLPVVDFVKDINFKGEGRIGFGSENSRIEVDNVFVTAAGFNPLSVEAQSKLTTTWAHLKSEGGR